MTVKSITEAATEKGVTRNAIHKAIKRGDIKAQRPFPGKTSMTLVVADDLYNGWEPKGWNYPKGVTSQDL